VLSDHVAEDWYREAFGILYSVVYAHRTVEAAGPEVAFAAAQVDLGPGERVLDLCCGNGRHMVHLAERGAHVTGLDYSEALLALARDVLADVSTQLVRGDMRALPFGAAFDVIFSFFTSFGYFFHAAENVAVVRGVADALKSGGRFFVDYLNEAYVVRTLNPESVRHCSGHEIHEWRWIDATRRRVNKRLRVMKDGRSVHESSESVQLYSVAEFRALLEGQGIRVKRLFGDYHGAEVSEDCPRMIVVGERE